MNWASSKAGAKLVDFSSELEGCPAFNVLDDDLSTIWLSEEGFPQWLCISLAQFKHTDNLVIRTVGWNCWHSYITNPKIVSMHVSSDGAKFKMWDSFEVPLRTRGTQLFSCAPVDAAMYPFIALEVTQTFGGAQTYMNRVFLYSDEVTASPTSSKDGQSTISEVESEKSHSSFINSHANNLSDLSARTPERAQPSRVSHDTELLVEQLQDALGLRTAPDDSYYSDDFADGSGEALGSSEHIYADMDASPATVAGRLASLEHTVHALEHTVLDHYSRTNTAHMTAVAPGVSFARSPTPPSRAPSRSHSPATSQASSHSPSRRRAKTNKNESTKIDGVDEQRVTMVTDRLNSIEEKFTRLLNTLESSWMAPPAGFIAQPGVQTLPETPARPPPPPLPIPDRTRSPARSVSQFSQINSSSLRSAPSIAQRLSHGNSSLINASIRDKPKTPPRDTSHSRQSSPNKTKSDGTERVMEQVVRSVETMMHRVLAQHESKQQHRISSMDSTINSSSAFEAAEVVPREFVRQFQEPRRTAMRSESRSRSASRTRNEQRRYFKRDSAAENSDDEDSDMTRERINERGRGVGDYISGNAKRLLLEKKHRAEAARPEQHLPVQRAQKAATERGKLRTRSPPNRIRAVVQERSHTRVRSNSNSSSNSTSTDGSEDSATRRRKGFRHAQSTRPTKTILDDKESHNVLEKSIFELLKSKYGLGVTEHHPDDQSSRSRFVGAGEVPHVRAPAPSLPMRVPANPSSTENAVVDWSQYVKNRVASGSGTSSRHGSPLRHGSQGVYSVGGIVVNSVDNIDVLPRARQSLRDSRRERALQQNAASDRSESRTRESGCSAEEGGHVELPAWCGQDEEMAQLVRSLHEKVYQRTIKEAQYDMLLSAQR